MNFRYDINALRALAVLLVVLFHFQIPGFKGGFIGVDIFFVISGYLMTKIIVSRLQAGDFSYLNFLAARIARIWPALIVVIFALLVLGAVTFPPSDLLDYSNQARSALLFYSNHFYKAGQGYFGGDADDRWLLHTWSLSVEWQFYMLFPLFIWAVYAVAGRLKFKDASRQVAIVWALISLFVLSLLLSVFLTRGHAAAAFFFLPFRAWEMTAGGLLFSAELRLSHLRPGWGLFLRIAGLIVLGISMVLASAGTWEAAWPGYLATFPVLASVLFLAGNSGAEKYEKRIIRLLPIQKIGLWSYSIYLWHWPVYVALGFFEIKGVHLLLAKLAGIALSIFMGCVSYHFVETRFKLRSYSWRALFQRSVAVPALSMFAVVATTSFVAFSNGWESRVRADAEFYRLHEAVKKDKAIPDRCGNFRTPLDKLVTCSINPDETGPRVLVYGDSHAQHLYAWFEKNAKARVDFFTAGGCPPFGTFNRIKPGYFCDEFNAEAVRRAQLREYGTVIIAGHLGYSADQGVQTVCKPTPSGCAKLSADEVMNATAAAWSAILASGKKLVVVRQNAWAPYSLAVVAMRHQMLGKPVVTTFNDKFYPGVGIPDYVTQVAQKLNFPSALSFVDLRSQYCENEICQVYEQDSGELILLDHNHFRPGWIIRHGAAFLPYVKAAEVAEK